MGDPLDRRRLEGERPEAVARLLGRFALFERSARKLPDTGAEIDLDADTQERLRSMGYVE